MLALRDRPHDFVARQRERIDAHDAREAARHILRIGLRARAEAEQLVMGIVLIRIFVVNILLYLLIYIESVFCYTTLNETSPSP